MANEDEKIATTSDASSALMNLGDIQGVTERPQAIDANDRSGTEGIEQDEIRLPRLAIAQGLSPQLVPGEGQHIPGLSIGQMFNDVSEAIYGTGPLTVVPVHRRVSRIEFDPLNKKVPLDRNVPAGDDRLKWHGDEPPRATEFHEFVCLILQQGKAPDAAVVSIKTTNREMRTAATLFTTFIATRTGPIYSGLYQLKTKIIKGKNKDGQDTMYGVFIVKNAGFIPADTPAGAALLAHAKEFHDKLKTQITEGKEIFPEHTGEPESPIEEDPETAAAGDVAGSEVPPADTM